MLGLKIKKVSFSDENLGIKGYEEIRVSFFTFDWL